jgi:competence protein ComEC
MKLGSLIFFLLAADIAIFSMFLSGENGASITFFDVGQGDGCLITADEVDIMIDAGPGKDILYELEERMGMFDDYIDIVVISHPHADHYGGLEYVLREYGVGMVIHNGAVSDERFEEIISLAEDKGVPIFHMSGGMGIKGTGFSIDALYPPLGASQERLSGNDGSLVLLTDISGLRGLLTGDIGYSVESLISAIDLPVMDFLKVPHHGSASSSSSSFISSVSPLVAVLSVGRNSYGLPREEIIERFSVAGISLYRTDKLGSINVEKKDGKLMIRSID